MAHGKSKKGIVTISTKIEDRIQHELDKITFELGYESRSETMREIIYLYVDFYQRYRWCILPFPADFSQIDKKLLKNYFVRYLKWNTAVYTNYRSLLKQDNPKERTGGSSYEK